MFERLLGFAMFFTLPVMSYMFGSAMQIEEMKQWPMSRFCENNFHMACELHPDCIGVALMCFPHPDRVVENLQRKLEEG